MKYSPDLIKGVLVFPLNVMGVIPAFILGYTGTNLTFNPLSSALGGILIAAGLVLCWMTVNTFTEYGDGTPAPWAPPKKLVVLGLYRYVRNPMMLGVWNVLVGEAILFESTYVLMWFAVFAGFCLVLIPFWEEPDLERRLGEDFRLYKNNVPRWFPRLKPWSGPQ